MNQYDKLMRTFKQVLLNTIKSYVTGISDGNGKMDEGKNHRRNDISALKIVLTTPNITHDDIKSQFVKILKQMKTGLFHENSFFVSSLSCFGYKGMATGNSTLKERLYEVLLLPRFREIPFLRASNNDLKVQVAQLTQVVLQSTAINKSHLSDIEPLTSAVELDELDELSMDESESLGASFFNKCNQGDATFLGSK